MRTRIVNVKYKHVVVLTEYERGWGSREFIARAHKTKVDADRYVHEVNSKNTSPTAPEYYIKAAYIGDMEEREYKSINE